MMTIVSRARLAIMAGTLTVPMFATACNFKDQLLQPQQPSLIQPVDVTGVTGADAL